MNGNGSIRMMKSVTILAMLFMSLETWMDWHIPRIVLSQEAWTGMQANISIKIWATCQPAMMDMMTI